MKFPWKLYESLTPLSGRNSFVIFRAEKKRATHKQRADIEPQEEGCPHDLSLANCRDEKLVL